MTDRLKEIRERWDGQEYFAEESMVNIAEDFSYLLDLAKKQRKALEIMREELERVSYQYREYHPSVGAYSGVAQIEIRERDARRAITAADEILEECKTIDCPHHGEIPVPSPSGYMNVCSECEREDEYGRGQLREVESEE